MWALIIPLNPSPNVSCHESQLKFGKPHSLVSCTILEWLEFWVIMTIMNNRYLSSLPEVRPGCKGDVLEGQLAEFWELQINCYMGFLFLVFYFSFEKWKLQTWHSGKPLCVTSFSTETMASLLSLFKCGHFWLTHYSEPQTQHRMCLWVGLVCPFVQYLILLEF